MAGRAKKAEKPEKAEKTEKTKATATAKTAAKAEKKGAVITKVMKYELTYVEGCGSFEEMQKEVWELQRITRTLMNRTVQICFHWDCLDREHYKATGKNLDIVKETGSKRIDGYVYKQAKEEAGGLGTNNYNAAIQKAWKKYKFAKKDVSVGTMSLPSFKRDQPIQLDKKSIKYHQNEKEPLLELTLFSDDYKKKRGYKSNVFFKIKTDDNTQRSILSRVLSGEYTYGTCQLMYDRPKWVFVLTYNLPVKTHALDPDKILGVDMGEVCAVYASTYGERGSLKIEGGEVTAFAKKNEARIRSMQNQAAHCGEGRIGHGTKTRVADVYKAKDKVSNFRDTVNHRYSKAVVDYAVKTGCGVIQMEDLSGIKTDNRFLRHWTYYDLQMKIENKAAEQGITVRKIPPSYTSQRCSRCGHIDENNRPNQATFRCTSCGFKTNADYNASQNISIRDIDRIIEESRGANPVPFEKPE